MELQYSLYTTIVLLIIVALFSLLYSKAKKVSSSPRNLPPGPTKLPIIGNLHNLIWSNLPPHQNLRDLSQKYGPLMHLKLGEVSTLVASSPDMAREIMRTQDLSFAGRPEIFAVQISQFGTSISFAPLGEYLTQMKKLCVTDLLNRKMVSSFSIVREGAIGNLIEAVRSSSSSTINLTERLFEATSSIISRAAFGTKYDGVDTLLLVSAIKEAAIVSGRLCLADLYPSKGFLRSVSPMGVKLKRLYKMMDTALENIIIKHKSQTEEGDDHKPESEDFVDVLLRVQKSGSLEFPLTDLNIKAALLDMFSGGFDTSATTIEWAMVEMMKCPQVMHKAQTEIRQALNGKTTINESDIQGLAYLKLVIKETFRLHPPLTLLLPRECRESCVIDGFQIPQKTRVLVNAWAIGRDKRAWGDDAESFIPERFLDSSIDLKGTDFELVPFGSGRRICPGMSFGLATIEFGLSQLLYHFNWHLPAGMKPDELDMTEIFGLIVRRKSDLYLTASPFVP